MNKSYEDGIKLGWKAAGGKGKPPYIGKQDPKKVIGEISSKKEPQLQALAEIRNALQGQINAMWEAFTEVCQEDMGLEPETPLAAFFPPALAWLEVDLVETLVVDEDMKAKNLTLMRTYWQKRSGELTR